MHTYRTIGVTLLTATLSCSPMLAAQQGRPLVEERRQAMRRFDWMVGEWKGSGWIEIAGQGRRAIAVTQKVSSKVDGLFLVIDSTESAEDDGSLLNSQLRVISAPPPVSSPGPPGTYSWQELAKNGLLLLNEAQGTDNSIQVGLPFNREDCDQILDDSWREFCLRSGEPIWSRRTISLNDDNEWVETHEWRRVDSFDDRTWVKYFEVVLRRVDVQN